MHRVEGWRNEQHQIEVIRCKKLLNANDTTHPNGENVLHVGCVIVYLYRENSFAGKPENFTFFLLKHMLKVCRNGVGQSSQQF